VKLVNSVKFQHPHTNHVSIEVILYTFVLRLSKTVIIDKINKKRYNEYCP